MKKSIKIIVIIGIIIITLSSLSFVSFVYSFSIDNMIGGDLPAEQQNTIDNVGQNIVTIIGTIGSIISVVVLVALGIKYMMGSTEEKAEYKKTLLPYVIGASLLFGASIFSSIIYNIAIEL